LAVSGELQMVAGEIFGLHLCLLTLRKLKETDRQAPAFEESEGHPLDQPALDQPASNELLRRRHLSPRGKSKGPNCIATLHVSVLRYRRAPLRARCAHQVVSSPCLQVAFRTRSEVPDYQSIFDPLPLRRRLTKTVGRG